MSSFAVISLSLLQDYQPESHPGEQNLGLDGPVLQPQHQRIREEELPLQRNNPPGSATLEISPAPGQDNRENSSH